MTTAWDILHTQPRHQTRYPSEHAVRFLAHVDPPNRYALDIGCGAGRHTKLLLEHGYIAHGCDTSREAVKHTLRLQVVAVQASMTALPFPTDTFGVALAFGVFYYGTEADHEQAAAELRRVLAPGGQALVVHRSRRDSRFRNSIPTRGGYLFNFPGHPEHGMTMNFVSENDIRSIYAMFTEVDYEYTETSRDGLSWRDSDWLITVTK